MTGSNEKRISDIERVLSPDEQSLELRNSQGEPYYRKETVPGKGWIETLLDPTKRDGIEHVFLNGVLCHTFIEISLLDL